MTKELRKRARPLTDVARRMADNARQTMTVANTSFDAYQSIARYLGGRWTKGRAEFGFWTPELLDHRVPDGDVFLEVLSPVEPLDLTRAHQTPHFHRVLLPVVRFEALTFAAAEGLKAGTREAVGDFYAGDGTFAPLTMCSYYDRPSCASSGRMACQVPWIINCR